MSEENNMNENVTGEPSNIQQEPGQTYSQPDQTYSQPQQSYGQPQQSYGQFQQPYGQPYSQGQQYGNGMGVASMVLGIIGIVIFCIWYLSLPCAIVGLILGIVSKNKVGKNNISNAGIICSIVALGLVALLFLLALIGLTGMGLY